MYDDNGIDDDVSVCNVDNFISNDVWHFNHTTIPVSKFFSSFSNILVMDGQNDDPHRITM